MKKYNLYMRGVYENAPRKMEKILHRGSFDTLLQILDNGVFGDFIVVEVDLDNNWECPIWSGHNTNDYFKLKQNGPIPKLLQHK